MQNERTGDSAMHPTRPLVELGHRYQPRQSGPRRFAVPAPAVRQPQVAATPAIAVSPEIKSVPTPKSVHDIHPHRPAAQPPAAHPENSPAVRPHHPSSDAPSRAPAKTKPALPRQRRSLVLRRQISDRAAQYSRQSRAQTNRILLSFAFGGLAASLLLGGVFVLYAKRVHTRASVLSAQTSTATSGQNGSPSAPSEVSVDTAMVAAYTVAAKEPRTVKIAKLGVIARVYPTTTNLNGEPIPVSNIHDVGWLTNGSMPGGVGAVLFNGSRAGPSKEGVFAQLSTLQVGDPIVVELGDGTTQRYQVVSSALYDADKVDMNAATQGVIAGTAGLNLLTDTGRYNVRTNTFEQRLLVRAVLRS